MAIVAGRRGGLLRRRRAVGGPLSLKNYPFLDDHRIDDQVVLPWAVAVELMAETVQAAWPQWHDHRSAEPSAIRGIIVEDRRPTPDG